MKKVTYFDVEWANSKNKSICQMGILCEDFETDEPIFERGIYVNPEDDFDFHCVVKHQITQQKVANEPTFPQVWENVKQYLCDAIVIGHKIAGADFDALAKCLQRYNLDIPKLYYIDTCEIATRCMSRDLIDSFELKTICNYFGIDIETEHDAFDDACANKDLFLALKKCFDINLDDFVHEYSPVEGFVFEEFISEPNLRKAMCEIYGVIQGISLDSQLSNAELEYIIEWRKNNERFAKSEKIIHVIDLLDTIICAGKITQKELKMLREAIADYFLIISSSGITRSIQVLYGILKGIVCDKEINKNECENLRDWLYEHNFLKGNYPFDDILNLVETILQDNVITTKESENLQTIINSMLNPINELKSQVYNVKGCTVYLTGNFSYGRKESVAKFIEKRGGIVVTKVTKSLDIMLIGDLGSEEYAYGTFGGNIQKAMNYKNKYSTNTLFVTEKDFFSTIK